MSDQIFVSHREKRLFQNIIPGGGGGGGATELNDLTDVTITGTPTAGDILLYAGGVFTDTTPFIDLTTFKGEHGIIVTSFGGAVVDDNTSYLVVNAQELSVVIGPFSSVDSANSMSIGALAECKGIESTCVGYVAKSQANFCTSIGANTEAQGVQSIALGHTATATQQEAIAIGASATCSNVGSISIGKSSIASGLNSINIGRYTSVLGATATGSIAIGYNSNASSDNAIALGAEIVADQTGGFFVQHRDTTSIITDTIASWRGNELINTSFQFVSGEQTVNYDDADNTVVDKTIAPVGGAMRYIKLGNVCTVYGSLTLNIKSSGFGWVRVDLPTGAPSVFSAVSDCIGGIVSFNDAIIANGYVTAHVANSTIRIDVDAIGTGSVQIYFHASYKI